MTYLQVTAFIDRWGRGRGTRIGANPTRSVSRVSKLNSERNLFEGLVLHNATFVLSGDADHVGSYVFPSPPPYSPLTNPPLVTPTPLLQEILNV